MATKLKLYYDFMSQPSRALYLFLKLSKIPYQDCTVALRKGEHFAEEFKAVNRFQLVPCIVDDGFKLSESIAIIRYLAQKCKVPDNLYPQDVKKRALVDEYLEWQHLNTRFACANLFRLQFIEPLLRGKTPDEREIKIATKYREVTLEKIENLWLGSNKFIVGNDLSVADLFAACEIEQTKVGGYNPCKGRPKLDAWLKLVKDSTDPLYSEAHKHIWNFGKSAKL